MCLSIPGKVMAIDGNIAKVSVSGTVEKAGLQFINDINIGDYVLVHSGFVIQKISEEEANKTFKLFDNFKG